MKNEKSTKKALNVTTNIILILVILGALTFFFDANGSNDHIGWLMLLAFWAIRSLYGFICSLQEGNKKLAIVDFELFTVAIYFLFTRSMEYLL